MIAGMLLIILLCMILQALFSGLETGVISIHRMRLRHSVKQGEKSAEVLTGFLENTDRLLGTTLVGTNICVVVTSTVAAGLAVRLVGDWGETLSSAVVSVALLVCCEYLPKAWFHSKPLERCSPYAGFLRIAESILHPLSAAIMAITRLFLPGPSTAFSKSDPFVTREELKELAQEGAQSGVLSPRESRMIRRVFELSGKRSDQIMIPLEGMTYVKSDSLISEFLDIARESDFTRFPVLDEEKNSFVGILNVYHVLSNPTISDRTTAGDLARPPLFIPAGMPVDDVLPRLRGSRHPMCLVRAESGRTVGMLTIEDILKQIVGKL
jgi:CBS domain containing-hemolysin-like protein